MAKKASRSGKPAANPVIPEQTPKRTAKQQNPKTDNASESKPKESPLVRRVLRSAIPVQIHRSQIRFAPYNPRTLSPMAFRRLCESVKRFGIVEPPVVNRTTGNTVVGGHQRLRALDKVLGTEDYTLTVNVIEVSETIERELNIALNNPTLQGQYDLDLLQDVIGQIAESEEGDVHATGYSLSDLQTMFDDDFLAGAFADQRDEEKPHIDILEEMRQMGREEEKSLTNSQSAAQTAGAGTMDQVVTGGHDGGGVVPGADAAASGQLPDGETTDTEQKRWIIDGVDITRYANSKGTFAVKPDPDEDPAAYALWKKQKSSERETYINQQEVSNDLADTMVTLVFDNTGQIVRFLSQLKLDTSKRYFDAVEVAGILDLNL